jgi:hypothetical protein
MFPFFLLNLCLPFPLPLILPVELPGFTSNFFSLDAQCSILVTIKKKKKERKENKFLRSPGRRYSPALRRIRAAIAGAHPRSQSKITLQLLSVLVDMMRKPQHCSQRTPCKYSPATQNDSPAPMLGWGFQ